MKQSVTTPGKLAGRILLWFLALLMIVFAIGNLFKNDKQLAFWGTGLFSVTSGSMTPTIPVGSMILVKAVPAETLNSGDIITYQSQTSATAVTHRIVAIEKQGEQYMITTRGDANNMDDKPFPDEYLIGRVVYWIPNLGRFSGFLLHLIKSPVGIIMIIGIIASIFLVKQVLLHERVLRKEKQTKRMESNK